MRAHLPFVLYGSRKGSLLERSANRRVKREGCGSQSVLGMSTVVTSFSTARGVFACDSLSRIERRTLGWLNGIQSTTNPRPRTTPRNPLMSIAQQRTYFVRIARYYRHSLHPVSKKQVEQHYSLHLPPAQWNTVELDCLYGEQYPAMFAAHTTVRSLFMSSDSVFSATFASSSSRLMLREPGIDTRPERSTRVHASAACLGVAPYLSATARNLDASARFLRSSRPRSGQCGSEGHWSRIPCT